MAEAAGLAVGVVALAGLFNNAVDCFEYVQLGHNFGKDFQTCQLRLECARLRLSRWGTSLGLNKDIQDATSLQTVFQSAQDVKVAETTLGQILDLFSDAQRTSTRYKARTKAGDDSLMALDVQDNLEPATASLRDKMRQMSLARHKGTGLTHKTKWALYEGEQFRRLVEDIMGLLDGLVDLFPAGQPQQQALCEQEVSMIGWNEALPLLKEIASKQDKALAAALQDIHSSAQATYSIAFSGDHNQGSLVGVNNGTNQSTYNYYHGAKQQEATPKPSILTPFRRDTDFVERDDALSQIDQPCSRPSGRAALKLVEANEVIPIEPMAQTQAIELFEKKAGLHLSKDKADVSALAKDLEYMPLAIVQVAAYISRLAPRCSVQQYIMEFRQSDRKKSSLLNYEKGQLRRDGEAKNSIIITWQMSFDYIRGIRQSAADLLSLMSFFDSQGIPEALVRSQATKAEHRDEGDRSEESASEASQDDGFEEDIQTLQDFSFISLGADPIIIEMHKLVQLATRKRLEANHDFERWQQQSMENLDGEFPTGQYENWGKCSMLLPHLRLAQRPKERVSLLQWASLQYNGAWYMWQRGEIFDTIEMSVKAWKASEKMRGPDDEVTLDCMNLVRIGYKCWKL